MYVQVLCMNVFTYRYLFTDIFTVMRNENGMINCPRSHSVGRIIYGFYFISSVHTQINTYIHAYVHVWVCGIGKMVKIKR